MSNKQIKDFTLKDPLALTDQIIIQESGGTTYRSVISAVVNAIYPVGSFYVQYPDAASNDDATAFPTAYRPATLFGGTWVSQFDTENVFFRTAGTDYQTRTTGLSADEFQGFQAGAKAVGSTTIYYEKNDVDEVSWGVGASAGYCFIRGASAGQGSANMVKPYSDGTNGTPRTGAVTEPRNRLFKIWKRTA